MKDSINTYGALTVKTEESTFFEHGFYKHLYRNGRQICLAHYTPEGKRDRVQWFKLCSDPIELTRAQGFKYWERHFPDRICYSLPTALAEAIDRDFRSEGTFYSKKYRQMMGYAG